MTKRRSRQETGGFSDSNTWKRPDDAGRSAAPQELGLAAMASHSENGPRNVDRTSNNTLHGPLARAIEAQRVNLTHVRDVVASNVSLLRDAEGLYIGDADVGFCCEVIRDLLEAILDELPKTPEEVGGNFVSQGHEGLKAAIELTRSALFRVHALTLLVAHALQTEKDEYAANLRLVFVTVSKMMDDALAELDAAALRIAPK